MWWVFCCGCYLRPSQSPQRKFYMSSCIHVYCESCVSPSYPYCRRCCVNIKLLACDSTMPPEVKSVFGEYDGKVMNVIKAIEYQAGQRFGLMSHLRGSEQKYNSAKAYIRDAEIKEANTRQQLESTLRKIKELELANESLKKHLLKFRQTQPSPKPEETTQWFTHIGLPTNLNSRRSSAVNTPSIPFTPRNCYSRHKTSSPLNPQYPRSVTSHSQASTPSRLNSSRSIPRLTPISKNSDLLRFLNKK